MTRPFFTEVLGRAGAAFDRAMVHLALDLARDPRAENDGPRRLATLDRVRDAYSDPRHLSHPEGFFVPPSPIDPTETRVRGLSDGGAVIDLDVASAFEPVHPEPAEEYRSHAQNARAHARLWAHPTPRPAVVCVHGYLGGAFAFEEAAFDAKRLYAAGLDVMLVVLPFHGPRMPPGMRGAFPGRNPWRTVEGFAQAVYDLRAWREWLKSRGSARVGLFGMSLGGYTSSLLATVDEGWDFVVPMIPLASLADAYMEHRAGRPEEPPAWVRPRIEDAYRVVSPFARPPRVAPERVLVLAASDDRITPVTHAHRIARHFDAPVETFTGGHLLQLGRARAFDRMIRFFEGIRVIAPR